MAAVLDGVFAVNKPIGLSSAQVIRECQEHLNPSALFKPMMDQQAAEKAQEAARQPKRRRRFKDEVRIKMGHGGTLDPLATGVLILGVGKGTKSLQNFLDCTKTYETVVLFGASTDTYDRCGKVLKKTAYDHITKPMVEEALKSFRGAIQQVPPLYSALKMEGKPLYEYAREGKPIPREIATRHVNVDELEMVEWYEPGTHNHRWPVEEATTFERDFAEKVWKIEKDQLASKKLTPEEEVEESKALEEHENFKRKADERVDELVYEKKNKKRKGSDNPAQTLMSGALGQAPPSKNKKGMNLLPAPHDPSTPPPWEGKGPPAARLRMTVTSGFYVRSFCHDLGAKLGSAAMMAELCRSRQGDFKLGSPNCLEFTDLAKGEEVWAPQVQNMLALWNSKPPPAPQAAVRAQTAQPKTKDIQKSVESPEPERNSDHKKRKASEEPSVEGEIAANPSKRQAAHSKSASPKGSQAADPEDTESRRDATIGDKGEAAAAAATAADAPEVDSAKQTPTASQTEAEEWNGFVDTPETEKKTA